MIRIKNMKQLYLDGLFYKGSGIGRYYESLTKEFAKRGIKIYTCIPKKLRGDFEKDFREVAGDIEPIFVDYERFSLNSIFKQSNILKQLEDKVDLFFYPHINLPLYVPRKTIVTVHDLIPFTQYWDRDEFKRKVFKIFLRRALGCSVKIVVISQTVANELKTLDKRIENKAVVIYEFIDDRFVNSKLVIKRLLDQPYVLFVGNRKRHKNIGLLIKAFNKIKDQIPHYLVIAGAKDNEVDEVDKLKKELNIKWRIIEFIRPDDETLINLYLYADLFIFPSLFEGFGLPPLEAVNLNCPVILSDIPILREIFDNTGLYFNPNDENDLAKAILKVLSNNDLRTELLKQQKERVKLFDKEAIVNRYLRLFEEIIKER